MPFAIHVTTRLEAEPAFGYCAAAHEQNECPVNFVNNVRPMVVFDP